MNKIGDLIKVFSLLIVLFSQGNCRKYDIHEEAMNLYGENFASVLKRFRKTPDYLKILNDKMAELRSYFEDVRLQTLFYYNNLLKEKIIEILNKEEDGKDDKRSKTESFDRKERLNSINLRSPFIDLPNPFALNPLHPNQNKIVKHKPMRQGESGEKGPSGEVVVGIPEEEKKSPVESLDEYHMQWSQLTLKERNMFRELGFEFAGRIIHSIIQSMGEDYSEQSTRFPDLFEERHSTHNSHNVEHTKDRVHDTTPEGSTVGVTVQVVTTDDDTYRFRRKI